MKLEELEAKVNKLEAEVQATKDIETIKKLQRAYGYYLEYWQEKELLGLWSHSADISFEANKEGSSKGWNKFRSISLLEITIQPIPGRTPPLAANSIVG
jgi:hypothetical protein